MYYKLKSNVLFRNYETYGYITDDRNYRYIKDEVIGDRVVSDSGAVFLSALSKQPKSIDEICVEIQNQYHDIDFDLIREDAEEFFSELVCDGFICSGETTTECNKNDYFFSYKKINNKVKINGNKNIDTSTIDFFEKNHNDKNRLTSVHIEITSKCNERCIHCYIPHDNKIKSMDTQHIYTILEQCRSMNVLHITLSGGEPMLHKDFCGILKKCREYDFAVSVLTNLTLLTDKILDEMKLNSLLGVQTSLYSTVPAIHDSITKMTGSLKKTQSSILKIIDNNIPLQISCPVMKQNKDTYNNVIEWAKNYGINTSDDYALIAEYNHSTQNLCNRLSLDEIRILLNNKMLNDEGFVNKLIDEFNNKSDISPEDPVCSVCTLSLCIAENGNVYPCAGWQDYVIGNVLNEPLKNIWENSCKVKSLRNIKKKDFPQCMRCELKNICSMCMVRNANEDCNGNHLSINKYFCDITKLKKELLLKIS